MNALLMCVHTVNENNFFLQKMPLVKQTGSSTPSSRHWLSHSCYFRPFKQTEILKASRTTMFTLFKENNKQLAYLKLSGKVF